MNHDYQQKIQAHHLKRHAYLYVRQSTLRQVFENTESTKRQYALRDRAVALLESKILGRVKRCPGSGDCGWLFLDGSKNASRRWCSMEGCGNRAKVRRFLIRRKQEGI